jgi:hypothetical protein
MDVFKLRLKIDANEFEAEGSQEYVKAEREIFLDNIQVLKEEKGSGQQELTKIPSVSGDSGGQPAKEPLRDSTVSLADMERIARQDEEVIVLTALPQDGDTNEQDALVLLLLAHKLMRKVDNVPSGDVLAGMKQSGITVDRLDGIANKIPQLVLKTGVRKGTKYRLSAPGIQRATAVATTLLTHVG